MPGQVHGVRASQAGHNPGPTSHIPDCAWPEAGLVVAGRALNADLESDGKGGVVIILAVLLIALILGGLGFVLHVLWWIALVVLVLWLLGFLFRSAEGAGSRRRRWYRW
jgi:hypothetical protein